MQDSFTSWPDPVGTIGGQHNGLCGAGWPGALIMITGLHTGRVLFTLDVLDTAPPIDDSWEDIVEVSFVPGEDEVSLIEWGGMAAYPIPLTRGMSYRVRYCASGMDGAHSQFPDMDELIGDRYLLTFWPAPRAQDAVLKQTSEYAAYWHHTAAGMPTPISPQQIADQERQEREQADQAMRESADQRFWGDRPPTERQRGARGSNILDIVRRDRDFADAVSAADPGTQRAVARWTARRALEVAGLAPLPWVAAALAALESGSPLPQPFDALNIASLSVADVRPTYDPEHDPFVWLNRDPDVPSTSVPFQGGSMRFSVQHAALPALPGAADVDPLKAAMNALSAAAVAVGDAYPALFAEVRRVFPQLGQLAVTPRFNGQ